ncbi:MAG: hypothetical protein EA409_00345 [Saprospirales bacterium]|nr:MAG: hypothetical protein EA409_00345 [Saprospirales bacterium]
MFAKIIWWVIVIILMISCDRPGLIEIENKLDEEIKFYCSMSTDFASSVSQVIEVFPGETKRIYLGFGTKWTESSLKYHAESLIDTVFLEVGNIAYYCSAVSCKQAMFNIERRKSGRRILIGIDQNLVEGSFKEKSP